MEQVHARRAADCGASNLLVQRARRAVGHCDFSPTELVTTFVDLVKWVEAGVKPAGDNVLDPAMAARPTYGCTFTDKTMPRPWDNPALLAQGFPKPAACPAPCSTAE